MRHHEWGQVREADEKHEHERNADDDCEMPPSCTSRNQTPRPDIVITQGTHPSDTVTSSIPGLRRIAPPFMGEYSRMDAVFSNDNLVVVTTPHPRGRRD